MTEHRRPVERWFDPPLHVRSMRMTLVFLGLFAVVALAAEGFGFLMVSIMEMAK